MIILKIIITYKLYKYITRVVREYKEMYLIHQYFEVIVITVTILQMWQAIENLLSFCARIMLSNAKKYLFRYL